MAKFSIFLVLFLSGCYQIMLNDSDTGTDVDSDNDTDVDTGKDTCESTCSGDDVCDKSCNEEAETCLASSETVCSSWSEYRCSGSGCGGDADIRTVSQYCSGTSSGCDGVTEESEWEILEACTDDQTCFSDGESSECRRNLECQSWCDSDTGLCWQDPPSKDHMTWETALQYCEDGTWGDKTDWRLPNIDELISLLRGCRNGVDTGDLSLSECTLTCVQSDSCTQIDNCSVCSPANGADDDPTGCYWDPALSGRCSICWSSSSYADSSSRAWYVYFYFGSVNNTYKSLLNYARCVRGGLH